MLNAEIDPVYSPRETILSAINEFYNQEQGAASQLIADLGKRLREDEDGEIAVYDLLDDSIDLHLVSSSLRRNCTSQYVSLMATNRWRHVILR